MVASSAILARKGAKPAREKRPASPSPRRSKLPFGLKPRNLVEGVYVLLLGVLLMRLVWTMIVPIDAPAVPETRADGGAIDADMSVFSRFDPFGGTAEEAPAEQSYAGAAETTLDLRLVGTTTGGGFKSATIELPDGRQDAFALGDEVMGGVVLRDVLPNQAILSRNGLTETLTQKERDGRLSGRAPARSSRAAAPMAEARQSSNGPQSPGEALAMLSSAIRFVPARNEDGAISGYALQAGTSPALFEASGFADGDVVTSIDGIPAPQSPEALLELMADLPPGRPFTVTVERDGTMLDVPVDLRAN